MKINAQTPPSICGKIKPVLRERGLEISRQKSSRTTCFFGHSQIVPVEVCQGNKKKYGG
jgi:hypothetical protein